MGKKKETPSLVDRIWSRIKNNKLLAIFIVAGGIIIGLSTFTDSLSKLISKADAAGRKKQVTESVDPNTTDGKDIGENDDYFDQSFQVSKTRAGDIVNLDKEGISIDFSVKQDKCDYVLKKDERGRFTINPYNSYLALLEKGGPITVQDGLYSQPLKLEFKVTNNSGKSVFFTKALLKVSESRTDPFPVLMVQEGYEMHLPIINAGWGKAHSCKLSVNIIPTSTARSLDSIQAFNIDAGDIEGYHFIDLTGYFRQMGVNTDSLNNDAMADAVRSRRASYEYFAKMKEKYLGPFRKGMAKVEGYIFYEGTKASGKVTKDTLRFSSVVFLHPEYEPLDGDGVPDGTEYFVSLESDGRSYTKDISLSQGIKNGEFDRFSIEVQVPKSSRHYFDLILFYNNNQQFIIRNIALNYFVPSLEVY